jgi:hypothetical protein
MSKARDPRSERTQGGGEIIARAVIDNHDFHCEAERQFLRQSARNRAVDDVRAIEDRYDGCDGTHEL